MVLILSSFVMSTHEDMLWKCSSWQQKYQVLTETITSRNNAKLPSSCWEKDTNKVYCWMSEKNFFLLILNVWNLLVSISQEYFATTKSVENMKKYIITYQFYLFNYLFTNRFVYLLMVHNSHRSTCLCLQTKPHYHFQNITFVSLYA